MVELESSNSVLLERIANLESRVVAPAVDSPPPPGNAVATPAWVPSGSPDTKILVQGDSNSSGKIHFGSRKGKLGAALPGSSSFCAKLGDLRPVEDLPDDLTDMVIAAGTNDLRQTGSNPAELVKSLNTYITAVHEKHPAVHILLSGVLSTRSVETNIKIKLYNHFLKDLCTHYPYTSFIINNLSDRTGILAEKF